MFRDETSVCEYEMSEQEGKEEGYCAAVSRGHRQNARTVFGVYLVLLVIFGVYYVMERDGTHIVKALRLLVLTSQPFIALLLIMNAFTDASV